MSQGRWQGVSVTLLWTCVLYHSTRSCHVALKAGGRDAPFHATVNTFKVSRGSRGTRSLVCVVVGAGAGPHKNQTNQKLHWQHCTQTDHHRGERGARHLALLLENKKNCTHICMYLLNFLFKIEPCWHSVCTFSVEKCVTLSPFGRISKSALFSSL